MFFFKQKVEKEKKRKTSVTDSSDNEYIFVSNISSAMGWLVQEIREKIRYSLSKYPSATIETKKCGNIEKINMSDFVKTLPLGFAWLQASAVSKKVGGLPS